VLHIPQKFENTTTPRPALADRKSDALSELARQVHASHCQVGRAAADVLKYALACGDLLVTAKSRVAHGQWLPWLRRDCDLSERTANAYMQLVRHRQVLEANPQRAANLSLRAALRLVPKSGDRTPRPAKRPAAQPRARLDVVDVLGWWSKAGITDRRRFIDNVGWTALAEAVPQPWYPVAQQWLRARTTAAVPAAQIEHSGDLAIPDDLSIPVFLQRTEAKPKPKLKSKVKAAVS